jgi:hypothetical protein
VLILFVWFADKNIQARRSIISRNFVSLSKEVIIKMMSTAWMEVNEKLMTEIPRNPGPLFSAHCWYMFCCSCSKESNFESQRTRPRALELNLETSLRSICVPCLPVHVSSWMKCKSRCKLSDELKAFYSQLLHDWNNFLSCSKAGWLIYFILHPKCLFSCSLWARRRCCFWHVTNCWSLCII